MKSISPYLLGDYSLTSTITTKKYNTRSTFWTDKTLCVKVHVIKLHVHCALEHLDALSFLCIRIKHLST